LTGPSGPKGDKGDTGDVGPIGPAGSPGTSSWTDGTGRVTTNVNVGIGIPSRREKLTVAGTIQSTSGGFKFPDGTIQATAGSGDGHSLDAADGSPVDAVYVDSVGSVGNVGIGTTSPGVKLHVEGGDIMAKDESGDAVLWVRAPAGHMYLGLSDLTNNTSVYLNSNKQKLFFNDNYSNQKVTFDLSSGNVGIGTTSPSYKLHVIGDIGYTGGAYHPSDLRIEENIAPLTNAIDKISALRGICFNLKGESPSKRQVGVIAQENEWNRSQRLE